MIKILSSLFGINEFLMFLNLPVLANSECPWVYEYLAFRSRRSNGVFSGISSVNFAQFSFISVTMLSLNEQEKKKKNSP